LELNEFIIDAIEELTWFVTNNKDYLKDPLFLPLPNEMNCTKILETSKVQLVIKWQCASTVIISSPAPNTFICRKS